jgi:hypothetical protein
MEISANLMRMIQQQAQQRFEASQLACSDMTTLPGPPITEDPAGAIEKLAKSIRHTIALAEQLEHPPKAPPAPQLRPELHMNREKFDVSKLSDAELAQHLEIFERKEARERERAENYNAEEQDPNASTADRVADICRALNLPQFPKGHPWREKFLLDLTALEAFADQYRSIAPPVPEREAAQNDHPACTVPPDD